MVKILHSSLFGFAVIFIIGINHAFSRVVEFDQKVFQFTQNYCIKCHGSEKDKGDRTFHQLSREFSGKQMIDLGDEDKVNLLHDILDQLNLGEMPPKKKEVKQPKTEEIKQTIAWLTKTLVEWEKEKGPNQTVLRRLNRREYRNTMRDLLGLHDLPFDFTEDFPTDENNHGFTNVGDALNLSDQHLNAYLESADRYLRMAFRFDEITPFKNETIKPKDWGYPSRQEKTPWMYRVYKPNQYLDFAAGKKQISDHFDLGTFPHDWYRKTKGVQTSGYYKISITAEAVRRLTHPYDPAMIPTNLKAPMQLSLFVSRGSKGMGSDSIKSRSKIGLWDLADHQPKKFDVTVWMDKRDVPFLNWDTDRALRTIGCGTFVRNIIRTSNSVGKKVLMPGISWERTWCQVALFQMYGKVQSSDYMNFASMAHFHLPTKVMPNRFSWMVNGTFLKSILKLYFLALPDGLFADR